MSEDTNTRRSISRMAKEKQSAQAQIKRAEAEGFLQNLETRVTALISTSQVLNDKGDDVYVQDFLKFQNLVSENMAFMIIIEGRLKNLPRIDIDDLNDRFDQLVVAVWGVVMRGSLNFLSVIANDEYLPLGSREVFIHELRTLNDAHLKLSDDRYQGRLDDDILQQIHKAELILEEVIEKAPKLLLF